MTNIFGFLKRLHFVGIGGIGMSGIARVLKNLEFEVTGSDVAESKTTKALRESGIPVYIGHEAKNVLGAELVIYSSAIACDNPELLAAAEAFIPVITRGEMLGELTRLKYSIAVAGSHGKTTTTSMITEILTACDYDPTAIVGGLLNRTGSNARFGKQNVMVVEADESDKSFMKLYPSIAVITNIDKEHMDNYTDMDDVKECFAAFANSVPFYGCAVICIDDGNVADIIHKLNKRYITYGVKAQADVRGSNIVKEGFKVSFDVEYKENFLGRVSLFHPGDHIILNALAAIAASIEMQAPFSLVREVLASYGGVERRLSMRYESEDLYIIDDYGHHPTEIAATLKAVREALNGFKICAIFQPHRYTRTLSLKSEFAKCFLDADYLFITDIYAASEKPIEGVDTEMLLEEIKKYGFKDAAYLKQWSDFYPKLEDMRGDKIAVIVMGAGNISKFSYELADNFAVRLNV
jgi:UDP-N-acetylmuramate--alanine ligase